MPDYPCSPVDHSLGVFQQGSPIERASLAVVLEASSAGLVLALVLRNIINQSLFWSWMMKKSIKATLVFMTALLVSAHLMGSSLLIAMLLFLSAVVFYFMVIVKGAFLGPSAGTSVAFIDCIFGAKPAERMLFGHPSEESLHLKASWSFWILTIIVGVFTVHKMEYREMVDVIFSALSAEAGILLGYLVVRS